jgi:DNA-binding NtrC family response regulator
MQKGDLGTGLSNFHGKIAFVDDNKDILEVCEKIIASHGLAPPALFPSGPSLIHAMTIDHHEYAIVFLDYDMPEIDGIAAAKIIRQYSLQTKIILMSGYDFVEREASVNGFRFMLKPFTYRQLLEHLQVAIEELDGEDRALEI